MRAIFVLFAFGFGAAAQAADPNEATMKQRMDCVSALFKDPGLQRVMDKLGADLSKPTIPQISNDQYASPEDSGAIARFIEGLRTCGVNANPKTNPVISIWIGFSQGLFTYGDTALLLFKKRQDQLKRAGTDTP